MDISNIDKKKVQKWLSLLKNNTAIKINVLVMAMEDCNYDELNLLYDKVPSMMKGLLSLSFLKRKDYASIYRNSNVNPFKNVKDYIGLVVYIITKNSTLINKYIEYKSELDKVTLKGDYEKAKELIKTINSTIGYSYWAAIYEIKIERLQNGLTACSRLYNRLYHESKSIAQYYYYCAYCSSSLDYPSDKMKQTLWPESEPNSEFINNVIVSHCMPYMKFQDGEWLRSDTNSSIIDLYNNIINYLPNLKEDTINDCEVRRYLHDLNSVIQDRYLYKLCVLFGICKDDSKKDQRLELWNAYTNCNYDLFIEKSKPYIDEYPDDMEILGLYLKSLVLTGCNDVAFNKEGSIIDRVRYHYYELLLYRNNISMHRRKLLDICKSQFHIYGLRHLYYIIDDSISHKAEDLYRNSWKYSQTISPLDCSYYNELGERYDFIRKIGFDCDFWHRVFDKSQNVLSPDCFEMSLAKQDNSFTFHFIDDQFVHNNVPSFCLELFSSYVFNKYVSEAKYKEAVRFYVAEKLKNNQLFINIEHSNTISSIINNNPLADEIPLELVILYHLVNVDTDTVYLAYKNYLRHRHVGKASEINPDGDVKLKYFLSNIAVPSIITRHVLRFKSVKAVMEERIQICANLYEFYGLKEYNDEVSSLYKEIKIRELNNQIDESKIYVDVNSIKNHELEDAKLMYDMYESASSDVSYYDASSFGGLLAKLMEIGLKVQAIDEGKTIYAIRENANSEEKEQINYRKNVLKQIFVDVRNQFLFNPKYGLDNYLSTRIRHGTLINKLRNHFEENQLVTNVLNGDYGHNQYWIESKFKLRDMSALQCLQSFNTFSKQIDYIITGLKDEYIQVRTEDVTEKSKACFDYNINYFDVYINEMLINKEIVSFDTCYKEIIDYLWLHTDNCLEQMRYELGKAQIKLIEALHNLEKEINKIVENKVVLREFNDAISHCQNDIQTDVQTVSKWFKRCNNVAFDFTMSQVIDTCISSINRNNNEKINVEIACDVDLELRGEYFSTLYDMFHDILNNILDYESNNHVGGKSNIEVKKNNDYIEIRVSNPILSAQEENLEKKVKDINDNLNALLHSGRSRNEGNSGCSKIFNAVHNHLSSPNNKYINHVEDSKFIVDIKIEYKPLIK